MQRIRELAGRMEFLRAGLSDKDQIEAHLLSADIDRLYLLWGLHEVYGLEVDGQLATPESLADKGPEDLFLEALAAVKSACGLTESERKN